MKRFISLMLVLFLMASMITVTHAAELGGGGYNFVCADGGRYLNVYAGKDADGTNVCVWERDGSPEQNYTISDCGGGKYKLHPASSSSRVIDVNRGNSYDNPLKAGLNVDLWRTNDAPAQEFYITHVGNNLYKIELAALSGHVLQANNPNKNNGNVTLERYTGASNQHWKILKNGSQVTEPCRHNNTSNKNEKTTFSKKDNDYHTITITYDEVCNDCGKTINANQKQANSEKHSMSNNVCDKCGYEVLVVEQPKDTNKECLHSNTYYELENETYKSVDESSHKVTKQYFTYCSDCNKLLNKDKKETITEKHSISGGACLKCEYMEQKDEQEECKHKNTVENMIGGNSTYEKKNSEKHVVIEYYNITCNDCKTITNEKFEKRREENHFFSNGECVCGYKEIKHERTVSDGLYNIKNAYSGYMMNVYAGKDSNGTKVTVWENDLSNDQKIYISYQGDGKYLLKYNASQNGRVIDVNRGESLNASIDSGDKIDIWTSDDLEAQLFYINDCGNGSYTFELVSKPGCIIAPNGTNAAKTNGSQLILTEDRNESYQKWNIVTTSTIRKTAYVYNTDGARLNVRSSYSTNSSIVTKISEYETITVIGEKISGFYPVEYNGYTGYAHSDYITFSVPQREEKITAWVYKTGNDNLNVRSAAVIASGNIIGKFSPNQQITVLGRTVQNGFYKVKYGNQTGYVSAAYVSFTKPVATTPSKPTSSNTSSTTAANNAINNAQSSASNGFGKVEFVKANLELWRSVLDGERQATEAVYDVIYSINARSAVQNALGVSVNAVIQLNPSKLLDVFSEEAVVGVMSMVVTNEYYRTAQTCHNNFTQQSKNISTVSQATKVYESYRDALAYYRATRAFHMDTVNEYSKKGTYTKRMLDTFCVALATSSVPASELKTLTKAATYVTTTGQLLNLYKGNCIGTDEIQKTRTQWNNIWVKVK